MQERSVIHADFTIERRLNAPVAKVYEAFADQKAKELWFQGPTVDTSRKREFDFREGGSELYSGAFHDGTVHTFKAHYYDIVPEQRIVYTYEMYLNDTRISVSVATIELRANGDATDIILHESGVFLDEFDKPELREQGTRGLLDALEKTVTQ